jgi:hypothetical protein
VLLSGGEVYGHEAVRKLALGIESIYGKRFETIQDFKMSLVKSNHSTTVDSEV